ncbi:radical SAM protein [candidate division WOR-3 bacterium]|nr:radical SAM protein [candidate division WOR-3 bacterium]
MLKVNEIFYSIQGESSFSGIPFVFVRLTGCNLRCSYCDTKYAYEEGEELTVEQILKKIKKYKCRYVEITGGEPLLQEETPFLVDSLVDKGFNVLVETNGTKDISVISDKAAIIMDIKCPSSGEVDKVDWENIKRLDKKDEVKFVIAEKSDYVWAKKIIAERDLTYKAKVLLSPVQEKLRPYLLAEWILKDNLKVRFQLQLHKILWPEEKRGR